MPIDPPQPPADQLDWEPALSWLPTFAAADSRPGSFAVGEEVRPGVTHRPYVVLASEVDAFVTCLYDSGIVTGADWNTWLEEGGLAFYDDPDRLAGANLEQCRMLLIAHVRNDRFVDGHLLSVLRDGHLVRVLERIRELISQDD